MPYKVINVFKDTKDNNTVYAVGEEYPKTDHKPSKKRIEELQKKHPKYKRKFIEEVKEKPSSKK